MAAELSLEALRDEIDKIDEVIVRLLDPRPDAPSDRPAEA